ncbi:hypothetical protein [Fluviicola sp.]|uniref:hypothetical protein n=1 Tax=Fluviicola sp. TaxID=1917219 RepID=UPI0026322899|nr:hypothetical protein [Fluviicola sp.]
MNDSFDTYFQASYNKILAIYLGLLIGLLSFSAVLILLLVDPNSLKNDDTNELFQIIVPIVIVSAVSAGIFIMKKSVAQTLNETNYRPKLRNYQSSKILQLGLIDGAILFSNVVYLITSNTYFIYIALIALLYYLSLFPLKKRISQQLSL